MPGAALEGRSFPANAQGYRQLVAWASSFEVVRRAGVECAGSYGAALARHLHAEGIEVTEVNQPDKAARRRHGKTDVVDVGAAARAVLSGRATATAKTSDRPGADAAAVQTPQRIRDQVPYPGRQTSSRASWSGPTPPCARPWPA
ncbi:transposase [Streptomyces sp. NPDC005969]|uniref:IS110 family transposase n=1 Tax=Streptomyces sp. NPDC005969 TaxID=3156722 RepID=UPI0033EE84F9